MDEKDRKSLSFINKLFEMVEAPELDEFIRWAPDNQGFIMLPNEYFTKALSQYFKHANIASFIRQLNMYGFHKVSEGSEKKSGASFPAQWEFRHSSNFFKRGDKEGLKAIKRRTLKANNNFISSVETNVSPNYTNNGFTNNNIVKDERESGPVKSPYETPLPQQQQRSNEENQRPFQSYTPHNGLSSSGYKNSRDHVQAHIHHQQAPCPPSPPHPVTVTSAPPLHAVAPLPPSAVASVAAAPSAPPPPPPPPPPQIQQPLHTQGISTPPLYGGPPSVMYGSCPTQMNEYQVKLIENNKNIEKLMKINDIYREELTTLNYDIVGLIDMIKDSDKSEKGLSEFRSRILQRSAQRDMTIKNLLQSSSAEPWDSTGSVGSAAAHTPLTTGFRIRQTSMPNNTDISAFGRNPSTTSVTSNPYFGAALPVHYFPDYYQHQQQQQQQHQQTQQHPHPQPHPQLHPQQQPTSQGGRPSNEGLFLHRDIRYSVSSGQSRSRNHSVQDPLVPNRPSQGSTGANTPTNPPQSLPPPPTATQSFQPNSVPASPTDMGLANRGKRSSGVYAMLNADQNQLFKKAKAL